MRLKKKYKIILTIFLVFLFLMAFSTLGYMYLTSRVSGDRTNKIVTIKQGDSAKTIAKTLKANNLIRNEYIYLFYIKINKINNIKYGVYQLNETMDVKKIVKTLQEGSKYNPDEVTLIIREGLNMRDIAKEISFVTNNSYDDVLNKSNDIDYINSLKERYWFITDDLNNDGIYYKLEGYLFPDTYKLKNKDVTVEYIFDKMLSEMNKNLEPFKDKISEMTIHEYLTLASMIEKESGSEKDKKNISSVFLNRIKINMNLGSDVTTRYALKVDDSKQVLTSEEFNTINPYNTRCMDGSMNGKLPIGPISTVSLSSIDAAFNPSNSQYIYFIANIKTKETFFYENYSDFENKKEELRPVNGGF